jgi:hypothetical protein
MITWLPNSAYIEANSQPTYLPPRMSNRDGSRSSFKIVSEVHGLDSVMPGRSGIAGVVPVLITRSVPRSNRPAFLRR